MINNSKATGSMSTGAAASIRRRQPAVPIYCVGIVALQMLTAPSAVAQGKETCTASRPGFELCQRRSGDGAVDVERAIAPSRKVAVLYVRPGKGSERLAQRAMSDAFRTNAAPAAARPILLNALGQCIRSGAEISTRIGSTEWQFMREEAYACVVRIGSGADATRADGGSQTRRDDSMRGSAAGTMLALPG